MIETARLVGCEATLKEYRRQAIEREAFIYQNGLKNTSKWGIQYVFDGAKRYFVDRSRNDIVKEEIDSYIRFWQQMNQGDEKVYKVVDLGAGLGFGGYGIGCTLYKDWPKINKELVFTNIVHPPGFEIPDSAQNMKLTEKSGVIAELPPKDLRNKVDFLYSDGAIQWSKYPEIFLRGIFLMLRPGGVASIITPPEFEGYEMEKLIANSSFKNSHISKSLSTEDSIGREKVFYLYKPLGIGEELPDFCRRTNKVLSIFDSIPLS